MLPEGIGLINQSCGGQTSRSPASYSIEKKYCSIIISEGSEGIPVQIDLIASSLPIFILIPQPLSLIQLASSVAFSQKPSSIARGRTQSC